DAMRTFKVERIRELSVLPRQFDDPGDDLVAQLRNAWDIIADQPATEVVLRFRPEVAGRVMEAQWHPSQRVRELEDGALEGRGGSRSGSGSCPGAATWRSSRRPGSARTWRGPSARRSPATTAPDQRPPLPVPRNR